MLSVAWRLRDYRNREQMLNTPIFGEQRSWAARWTDLAGCDGPASVTWVPLVCVLQAGVEIDARRG
jgi:hypothetical protein